MILATLEITGNNISVVAVLEVNSVKKVTPVTTAVIIPKSEKLAKLVN